MTAWRRQTATKLMEIVESKFVGDLQILARGSPKRGCVWEIEEVWSPWFD